MESTTAVATPTSTTTSAPVSTAAAAPATSAPAETSAPVQRPTTFAEAFAREDAAVDTSTATPDGTATTEQVAADTTNGVPAPKPGEPPQEKWPTILENARVKGRAETLKEYGIPEGARPEAVRQLAQLSQFASTDPVGYSTQVAREALTTPGLPVEAQAQMVQDLLAAASSNPQLAGVVRTAAARILGTRTPQAPQGAPAESAIPDIPIMDGQGQVVGNLRDIVQQHIDRFAATELGPLKQDYQSRTQQAEQRQKAAELQQSAQDIYAEASQYPGFLEHKDEIAKVLETIPGDADKALRKAWLQVVGSKLADRDQVTADHLKTLQTKAAASGVNPASAAMPATKRPTSFHDASLQW